ncbi:hypothetical protein [Microbacterium pumilum]|uniref:Universal stress protein n=1 Tax=Microbacterium pumilum TaxID=344165 RepID=A0ABN2RS58_9MICO
MDVSVFESESGQGRRDPDGVRVCRDVGMILGEEEPLDHAITVAAQMAARSGGRLCLMRYVDDTRLHQAHELALKSGEARVQLANLRARCRANDPHLVITDRLHIGTLESLLARLEPSIGSLVIGSLRDPTPSELLAMSALPVTFVEPAGATFTPEAADDL